METKSMESYSIDLAAGLQRAHTEDANCIYQLQVRGNNDEQFRIEVTRNRMRSRESFAKHRGISLYPQLDAK
jgi:hypothetical protein